MIRLLQDADRMSGFITQNYGMGSIGFEENIHNLIK